MHTKIPHRRLYVGKTTVWVSDEVKEGIADFLRDEGVEAEKYLSKVEHYSQAGFHPYEGSKKPIRAKGSTWPGILAIEPWATLFRLYGFYAQPQKKDFVVPSCTLKTRKKMNNKDKRECEFAYEVLSKGCWQLVDEHGNPLDDKYIFRHP